MSRSTTPRAVLAEDAVYFGDNGRTICRRCAGQSALYTFRDISGHRVLRATTQHCVGWELLLHRPLACERGCTTLSTVAGADGWPMAKGGDR